MPWLFNTLHFQQKLAEVLHLNDSFRLPARGYAMNNPEKSPTRRRRRGVPTTYDVLHWQQQSVFLIFWTQNLVKGLPLRPLLNPSGPVWSYLRGVTEIVSIDVGGEGPNYVSSSVGCRRRHNQKCRRSDIQNANNSRYGSLHQQSKPPWPSPLASIGSDHRPKQRSIIMAEEIVGSPPMATTQYQWYHRRPADDNNPESF